MVHSRASHSSSRFDCRAFTLIELLVVVSIIALLIAILLPSIGKAKSRARTAACLSNVRQIALAGSMYATANDGYLTPPAGLPSGAGTAYPTYWFSNATPRTYSFVNSLLGPYLQNQNVVACAEVVATTLENATASGNIQTNYGVANITTGRSNMLSNPTDTVAMGDSGWASTATGVNIQYSLFKPSDDNQGGYFHGVHAGYGSVAFHDGHAESILCQVRPAATISPPMFYTYAVKFSTGSLCYGKIDPTLVGSNFTTYANQYGINYYFWADKANRQ